MIVRRDRQCSLCLDATGMTPGFVDRFNNVLRNYKLIVACGLPSTGKTTVLNSYVPNPGTSLTRWNRQDIYQMLFDNGRILNVLNNHIGRLEQSFLPHLMDQTHHQIIYEGWLKTPTWRRKLANSARNHSKAIIVFDGPMSLVSQRAVEANKMTHPVNEIPFQIELIKESFIWPKYSEGWDAIIYINTFGSEGVEFLRSSLNFTR